MATGYMYPAAYPVAQRTNGFAITSFVLSLVGLCGIFTYGIGGIGSILAVIFGHIAISQINRSSGTLGGKGLAIAGLVMGYIGLAGVVIVIAVIIFGTLASSSFQ